MLSRPAWENIIRAGYFRLFEIHSRGSQSNLNSGNYLIKKIQTIRNKLMIPSFETSVVGQSAALRQVGTGNCCSGCVTQRGRLLLAGNGGSARMRSISRGLCRFMRERTRLSSAYYG